jgi:hypothetical protein
VNIISIIMKNNDIIQEFTEDEENANSEDIHEEIHIKHKLTQSLKNINPEKQMQINKNLKYILDPLSVIIKLAILSYKPLNTKLSIYNNMLCIQEPGIFQSIVRYYFNNTRFDIYNLYNPIHLACIHFLKNSYNGLDITKLFKVAKNGIQRLITNYKDTQVIIHTLYMYYNIIENHLLGSFNPNLFMPDPNTPIYNTILVNSLNAKWTYEKIKVVLNFFEYVDNDTTNKSSIKCIDEFMINIDNETYSYIHFINS